MSHALACYDVAAAAAAAGGGYICLQLLLRQLLQYVQQVLAELLGRSGMLVKWLLLLLLLSLCATAIACRTDTSWQLLAYRINKSDELLVCMATQACRNPVMLMRMQHA